MHDSYLLQDLIIVNANRSPGSTALTYGKTHLTYAQGAAAELVAAGTIGMSSGLGLPVSTTHVLSSGIAGSMVGVGGIKNLQRKTITMIALAWILTLPVTFVGAMLLYYFFHWIF